MDAQRYFRTHRRMFCASCSLNALDNQLQVLTRPRIKAAMDTMQEQKDAHTAKGT